MLQIIYVAQINQTNSIIQDILETNFDIEITILSHEQAFKLEGDTECDLIIYDLNTSLNTNGAPQQIQAIKQSFKDTPLITLQSYLNNKLVASLLESGANGIIPIAPSEEVIRNAVKETLKGNTYVSLN